MKIRGLKTLSFLVFLSFPGLSQAGTLSENLDAFMADLMASLDVVPGYSIAVVQGDKILIAKGYGILDIENPVAVGPDSQFYIASSTKSFTGLAIASLAQKGIVDLNTPIETYIPALKGSVSGSKTLKQLLTHTHGLTEEALTWRTAYSGDYTREKLIDLVRNMPEGENPGEFDYQNTGYVIAGLVAEEMTGKPWKQVVREEVLDPLGMTETIADVSRLEPGNYAMPHSWFGKSIRLPFVKADNTMHAAGGHFSTATDMAVWLEAQLNDGFVGGKQVFPKGLIESTHAPLADLDADFYTYKRQHYGFGWYVADYMGYKMFHHFGSFSGYRSHISFIPELNTGVAVLINDTSRPGFNLPDTIANYIYELAAGQETAGETERGEIAQLAQMVAPLIGRDLPERPRNAPADEARFEGAYSNPDFGTIAFAMEDGELVAHFGNLSSKTTYKEDGSIRMELEPGSGTLGVFVEGGNGQIEAFRYRGVIYSKVPSR